MAEESTTTLGSKSLDLFGSALGFVGFLGFLLCWGIGWNSEQQVLGRAELRHPSAERTAPIEMKGVTWYVEPGFANRYKTADDLILVFWIIGAAGLAIKGRKDIANQFRESRRRGHVSSQSIGRRASNQPQEPDTLSSKGSLSPFGWAVWAVFFASAIVLALPRGAAVIERLLGHS